MSSGPGALRPAHSMRAGLPAPMRHRSDARCLPLVRTSSKLAKSRSIVFSSGNGTFCVPGRTSAVFVDSSRGFARCHCVSTEPGFETLMSTSAPGCQRSDSETDRDRPRCGECRQRDFPAYLGRTETDRDPVTVLLIPRSKVRILHGPLAEPVLSVVSEPARRTVYSFGRFRASQTRTSTPWAAPLAAIGNGASHDFFSARMGRRVFDPLYGMDIAALCIRSPST